MSHAGRLRNARKRLARDPFPRLDVKEPRHPPGMMLVDIDCGLKIYVLKPWKRRKK